MSSPVREPVQAGRLADLPNPLSCRAAQAQIRLSEAEANWLQTRCPSFKPAYVQYLSMFQFEPDHQVQIDFVPESTDAEGVEWGAFEILIKGNWAQTILWEVPLMSIISEAYFTTVDTKWDYVGQFGKPCGWRATRPNLAAKANFSLPPQHTRRTRGARLWRAGAYCQSSEQGGGVPWLRTISLYAA